MKKQVVFDEYVIYNEEEYSNYKDLNDLATTFVKDYSYKKKDVIRLKNMVIIFNEKPSTRPIKKVFVYTIKKE